MPCFDSQVADERKAAVIEREKLAAMLCGITKAFSVDEIIAKVNWSEVGVGPDYLKDWIINHRAEDSAKNATEPQMRFYNVVVASPITTGVDSDELWKLTTELLKRKGSVKIYGELSPLLRTREALELMGVNESGVAVKFSDLSRYPSDGDITATVTILETPQGKVLKELCAGFDNTKGPNLTIKPRILVIGGKKVLVTFDVYPK